MRYVVAARDDDVIEVAEWQRPEHRVKRPSSAMDEDQLIGIGVAIKLFLWPFRAAPGQSNIVVSQEDRPSRDGVAAAGNRARLQMMMPQRGLVTELRRNRPRRLEPHHASRRSQMVDNAVRARETRLGDDFFVVNPLAVEAGLVRVGQMPLAGKRAETQIGRHAIPPDQMGVKDGERRGCARFPGVRPKAPPGRRA